MKNFSKNSLGFAHHALLGVLVVAITSFVGVKVLTSTHALEASKSKGCSASAPAPTITPNEDTTFANKQDYVTIDVAVPKCKQALTVKWFRNGKVVGINANIHNATAANGYKDHFRFNWIISHASANSYHWVAKIQNRQGAFFAANNQGQKYLDLLVIGNGYFIDNKFVKPYNNNAVWKRCDNSNFLRVETEKTWYDGLFGDGEPTIDVKGVQFINTTLNNPIKYMMTKPSDVDYWSDLFNGDNKHKKEGFNYYPVGAACLKRGAYNWIARVIDTEGGVRLAHVRDDGGVYHLNITVE